MGKSYREYYPDHLVYFVSDVVDHLNLAALDAAYGVGTSKAGSGFMIRGDLLPAPGSW